MVLTTRGWNWGSLYSLLQALTNRVFQAPALTNGATTWRIKITNAVNFAIGNVLYAKAATDNIDVTTGAGLTNTIAAQFCKLRVEIDSAGTVTVKQGAITAAQALAPIPARTASRATLGYIQVPASFTFGTTGFDAAGVVFTDGDPDLGDGGALPPSNRGISQTVNPAP